MRLNKTCLISLGALVTLTSFRTLAFQSPPVAFASPNNLKRSTSRPPISLQSLASSGDVGTSNPDILPSIENMSTLTLLEHINLNVPNHDYILEFYCKILGFGLDPRRAMNVVNKSGTVWVNCGASQFHLPFGEEAQVIPGSIGLWYDENGFDALKGRLASYDDNNDDSDKPFAQFSVQDENGPRESVRIMDHYGNVIFCRRGAAPIVINDGSDEIMRTVKQPILKQSDVEEYSTAAETYGLDGKETECKGIGYVEFFVPRNTAAQIAEFYDCVFDATTSTFEDPSSETNDQVAIVAFGAIDVETGRSSQSLIFRESDVELPKYDGHHIALYVGNDHADFEQAFKNVEEAGVLWVNPRFSDKVTNLNTAKKWKQFRFKNVLDLKTGKTIFTLEHEVRSVEHDAWPGERSVNE